ncbi:TraH family protein [Oryzicola mucosus]|uniref:Conjugal transfer protein TraH n=1 Tax=Oryzicola mucosus TaxID=2767425 RepID=A0A8J6Q533_9HYPH|nr:TraH family protein [Oryzicola mucosus]MBD0416765.1 conjugal transfer protein TraH [Oryzicola mucosus]
MIDAALIKQCADPGLKPAIVEQLIERAGAPDPLAITVRSGNRAVLFQKPSTPDLAMKLIRQHIGRSVVRVGITQYPAGVGLGDSGELKRDMLDACENIRMGTALFARIYRIVAKWYGSPTEQEVLPRVFDEAVIAWQTGYFEGVTVFQAPNPGKEQFAVPIPEIKENLEIESDRFEELGEDAKAPTPDTDPNNAGIRVDLSGVDSERP